jgi:BirA family biotin operon repressor/biotin-[acetyl-CoA-carboxylase] ligase
MRSPVIDETDWLTVEETGSTQSLAAAALQRGEPIGAIFAHEQTDGRGRFGRRWVSVRGDSLTFSLTFSDYADHPKPYLIGMSVAIAAAGALHCQLRWPNDLIEGKKKIGGILTELLLDREGRRIPVVGVGVNLNQTEFPDELKDIATSAHLAHGGRYIPEKIGRRILDRLLDLPEPTSWEALAPIWNLFDATPGKRFRLSSGEEAIALAVGSDGQLMCSVEGESRAVLAAEAVFG